MTTPTPKEEDFLIFVYNYYREYRTPPDTPVLKSHLHVEKTRISDLKTSLKRKKYLDADTSSIILTDKAIQYVEEHLAILKGQLDTVAKPLYLPLLGEVKAGDVNPEELVAYGEYLFEEEDAPTEPIPYIGSGTNTFLLRVVGKSMEREGIFEGDYLITEKIEKSNIKQGDLIVTKYLPWSFAEFVVGSTLTLDDFEADYRGPVVKYCNVIEQELDGVKRKIYRLGWRKDTDGSPYTLRALDIQPKGKVIGVYRRINNK